MAALFNSLHFLLFLPCALLLYFLTPRRFRWVALLLTSYYFYMSWKAEYVVLIIASTLTDYIAARCMTTKRQAIRKLALIVSLIVNFGLLFSFKYFNFFSDATRTLLAQFSIPFEPTTLNVLLPIGISFYTFQTVSYTIDVYNRKIKPERHLGIFAVYVSFFPQLVAGPIERAKHLLGQLYEQHRFDVDNIVTGLKQMAWGFFKKLVIADNVALLVNDVYADPTTQSASTLFLATVLFGIQIYTDFSGYSDIAIGTARLMGFRLIENFRRPYFATSIREFWHRWHISLSTWFRDYVYIPLGGSKVPVQRQVLNLALVFLVSGLWHGANWTFLLWGALHGALYIVYVLTAHERALFFHTLPASIRSSVAWLTTFVLVMGTWLFFRSDSLATSWTILTGMIPTGIVLKDPTLLARLTVFALLLAVLPVSHALQHTHDLVRKYRYLLLALLFIGVYAALANILHSLFSVLFALLILFGLWYGNVYNTLQPLLRVPCYLSISAIFILLLQEFTPLNAPILFIALAALFFVEYIAERKQQLPQRPLAAHMLLYMLLLMSILLFGRFEEATFIYFQF